MYQKRSQFTQLDTQVACTVDLERSRWLFTFEALTLINVHLNNPFRNDTISTALKAKESLYTDMHQQSIRVIYLCAYKEKNRFLQGRP